MNHKIIPFDITYKTTVGNTTYIYTPDAIYKKVETKLPHIIHNG